MSLRLLTACAAAIFVGATARATAQAPPQPGPPRPAPPDSAGRDGATPDGYEDCTQGGGIALSVVLADAATGRGLPWRAVPYARVEWRAGRSGDTAYDRPNFGPGRDYPTEGTADGYSVGVVWGRPGTYRLTVRAPGYLPWDTAGVRVAQASPGAAPFPPYAPAHCAIGPDTVVVARLRPAAPGAR